MVMLETDSNSVGVKHNIENKIILISQWYELCMLPELGTFVLRILGSILDLLFMLI